MHNDADVLSCIMNFPEQAHDWVRCGIGIYGGYINDKNFIGWPGLHWMGGHTIEEKCIMRDVKRKDGRHDYYEVMKDRVIGFLDKHPNEDGHVKIMRHIYEQLG